MRRRLLIVLLTVVTAAVALPGVASASQLIDRDVSDISLQVNAKGEALLSYVKKETGKQMHVLAWGAINALPPTPGRPQVEFKLDYAGGWGKYRKTTVSEEFRNVCGPYRGPALSWLVTACTAPDGTHWALQSWQRMLPNYGLQAKTTVQAAWELRLSHWEGELPELRVNLNWAYRKFDHIFGSFSYGGQPVHGFKSTSRGNPLDSYGRNLYVDTLDSAYGNGWKRENSFLMHKGNGKFCYGFYPHNPRPSGMGKKYRATIIGPGVTPDMMWQGTPLGAYSKGRDLALHQAQKAFYGSDGLCKAV